MSGSELHEPLDLAVFFAQLCNIFEAVSNGRTGLSVEERGAVDRLTCYASHEIENRVLGSYEARQMPEPFGRVIMEHLTQAARELARSEDVSHRSRQRYRLLGDAGQQGLDALADLRADLRRFRKQPDSAWATRMYRLVDRAYDLAKMEALSRG